MVIGKLYHNRDELPQSEFYHLITLCNDLSCLNRNEEDVLIAKVEDSSCNEVVYGVSYFINSVFWIKIITAVEKKFFLTDCCIRMLIVHAFEHNHTNVRIKISSMDSELENLLIAIGFEHYLLDSDSKILIIEKDKFYNHLC